LVLKMAHKIYKQYKIQKIRKQQNMILKDNLKKKRLSLFNQMKRIKEIEMKKKHKYLELNK